LEYRIDDPDTTGKIDRKSRREKNEKKEMSNRYLKKGGAAALKT